MRITEVQVAHVVSMIPLQPPVLYEPEGHVLHVVHVAVVVAVQFLVMYWTPDIHFLKKWEREN